MKKILFLFSLLLVALFLIGCAEEELSLEEEQELEAEIEQLSDEELDQVIESMENDEDSALAGQAVFSKFSTNPARALSLAYKVKAERYQSKLEGMSVKLPGCPEGEMQINSCEDKETLRCRGALLNATIICPNGCNQGKCV